MRRLWFGGSFNPVHFGHLLLAESMRSSLDINELWLLPVNNHSFGKDLESAQHRLKMLKIVIQDFPHLLIDERELLKKEVNYTVDSLSEIRIDYGSQAHLNFAMGMDAFNQLDKWSRFSELFVLANIIVMARPGQTPNPDILKLCSHRITSYINWQQNPNGKILFWHNKTMQVDSTIIRKLVREGNYTQLDSMLPQPVIDYIHKERLYL